MADFSRRNHLFGIRMSSRRLGRGDMLTFFGMLAGMADPLRKMSDIFSNLQAGFAASDRIFSRSRPPAAGSRSRNGPAPSNATTANWCLRTSASPINRTSRCWKRSTLKIAFGETIAFVGPNGCGKSTLANLIPRFADPTAGMVKLDGVPLPDMRLRDVRGQIGLVTQETMLFDDTIFNNIRYGSPKATREQVIEASKQAHAHRFIEHELPNGYETSAGALGNCLSGGQRQRHRPGPGHSPRSGHSDPRRGHQPGRSRRASRRSSRCWKSSPAAVPPILITHRMAVLSLADRIVAMEAGRFSTWARHEELLSPLRSLPPAVPDPLRGPEADGVKQSRKSV